MAAMLEALRSPGSWVVGLVGLSAGLLVSSRWLLPRWREMRAEIRRVCTCGHLPEPPTAAAVRTMKRVCRAVVWFQVGRIELEGAEHLDAPSPRLVVSNHGHYLDPFVLALLLEDRTRCMAARGLLEVGGGLGGLVLSSWGAFCTDLDRGKGAPALRAAVRVLASGQNLVMFPEAWANMDGEVRPFEPGAASVARMAAARLGRPVPIVPVYLRYGTYPRPWIMALPTALQCLLLLAGFARFRRGVKIVAGRPLLSSELPRRAVPASEELRRTVLALDPRPLLPGG